MEDRLKALRKQCHEAFDEVWQSGEISRADAYVLLATALNKPLKETHIAMMSEEDCLRTLTVLKGHQ